MTLDDALDLWARWVVTGAQSRGFQSMLHMMMVTQCNFSGSSSKRSSIDLDCVEADIEACLLSMRSGNDICADVIKREYMTDGSQFKKAAALQMPLRTYKRKLKAGKATVLQYLAIHRGGRWIALLKLSELEKDSI